MHILRLSLAAIHAESSTKRLECGVKELIPVIGIEFEDNYLFDRLVRNGALA